MLRAISILFVFTLTANVAQASNDLRFFQYTGKIPETLLQGRAAVFITVPFTENKEKEDWKPYAAQVHEVFKAVGVDAIGYFNYDVQTSCHDAKEVYSDFLVQRQVEHLVFVEKKIENEPKRGAIFEITFTGFNETPSLTDFNQPAWHLTGQLYPELLRELFNAIYRAELPRDNHLIIDFPEYFEELTIQKGNRYEEYPSDLRIDKLAVPLFEVKEVPENAGEDMKRKYEAYNQEVLRQNEQLKSYFAGYPFEYRFVEYVLSDEKIWREGYTYVLEVVYAEGEAVKSLLGYTIDDSETGYVTYTGKDGNGIKTLKSTQYVYKYFVSHAYNKSVSVGKQWDADLTWNEALQNSLRHIEQLLKK